MWLCACQCGNTAWVDASNLRTGISTNCGCLRETTSAKQQAARTAAGKANRTHGMSNQKLLDNRIYRIWASMKRRCDNANCPEYKHYGARGISYYPEWGNFETFHQWAQESGYNDSLTIERQDNNGNYTPENCCWITQGRQNWNTRRNIRLPSGEPISSFCDIHKVPLELVWHTLKFQREYPQAWKSLLTQIAYNEDHAAPA
jgi:hypothetical protein